MIARLCELKDPLKRIQKDFCSKSQSMKEEDCREYRKRSGEEWQWCVESTAAWVEGVVDTICRRLWADVWDPSPAKRRLQGFDRYHSFDQKEHQNFTSVTSITPR